jgi:biopolymer transport protein ExbB
MLELMKSGGWLMVPILLCSVVAMAIVVERFWTLQAAKIIPNGLVMQVWEWSRADELDDARIRTIQSGSPLGRLLAAGLANRSAERKIMKEAIEEVGRHVVHELERYLNALGTVALITPLIGLLGTVIGMVKVFTVITVHGVGNPEVLADGISQALITTATGISVAIPALLFYRFFQRRVDELVITMEQEALKMVEVLHGQRT